jgi:hypothetical protein
MTLSIEQHQHHGATWYRARYGEAFTGLHPTEAEAVAALPCVAYLVAHRVCRRLSGATGPEANALFCLAEAERSERAGSRRYWSLRALAYAVGKFAPEYQEAEAGSIGRAVR